MKRAPSRQAGHSLLLILILLLLGASSLDSNLAGAGAIRDRQALVAARDALLGRAVSDENRPGSLPCPDFATDSSGLANRPGDGKADMLTRDLCPSPLGWLPWDTLNMARPGREINQTLWYVIGPRLRDDNSALPINADTPTGLRFAGQDDVAVLLIDPGPALAGQKRPSLRPVDYLEYELEDSAYLEYRNTGGNDRIMVIHRDEWMAAVSQRVANAALRCLDGHARTAGRFPWPAPLGSPASQGEAERRFGRLPTTQPSAGAHLEVASLVGQLAASELAFASPVDSLRQSVQQLGEQVTQSRNLASQFARASQEMQQTAQATQDSGNALRKTIALAIANDRIARSEGSAIRLGTQNLMATIDHLDERLDALGFDALAWQAAHEGATPPDEDARGRLQRLLLALQQADSRFASQDLANPRPLQQALVPYVIAVDGVAVDLIDLAKIIGDQAAQAGSAAGRSLSAANTLLTAITTTAAAIEGYLEAPSATRQAQLDSAMRQVQSEQAQLLQALSALEVASQGQAASAWPLAWASAHCDFLAPGSSNWWHDNHWSDQVFYQIAEPGKAITVGNQTGLARAVIAAGPGKNGQKRPSTAIADYLEGINADPSRAGHASQSLPRLHQASQASGINDRIAY